MRIRENVSDVDALARAARGYAVPLLKLEEYSLAQKQLAHEIQSGYGMNIQRAEDSAKEAPGGGRGFVSLSARRRIK